MSDRDHRELMHDLRMRVLDGEDISAREMFLIVDEIRQGRRSAGAPPSKGGSKKSKAIPPDFSLKGLLDQELP